MDSIASDCDSREVAPAEDLMASQQGNCKQDACTSMESVAPADQAGRHSFNGVLLSMEHQDQSCLLMPAQHANVMAVGGCQWSNQQSQQAGPFSNII